MERSACALVFLYPRDRRSFPGRSSSGKRQKVFSNYPELHPAFHSFQPIIATARKSVAPLEGAGSSLASGSPAHCPPKPALLLVCPADGYSASVASKPPRPYRSKPHPRAPHRCATTPRPSFDLPRAGSFQRCCTVRADDERPLLLAPRAAFRAHKRWRFNSARRGSTCCSSSQAATPSRLEDLEAQEGDTP